MIAHAARVIIPLRETRLRRWDFILYAGNFAARVPDDIPNPEMQLIFLFANTD